MGGIRNILICNAGSSSFKASLYRLKLEALCADAIKPTWFGQIDWHVDGRSTLSTLTYEGSYFQLDYQGGDRASEIQELISRLWHGEIPVLMSAEDIDVVGHRVVHGGTEFRQATRIDAGVKAAIHRLASLAPLHNPNNLLGIEILEKISSEVPQIAVFDTGFFADLPEVAYAYPGVYQWLEQGIRKYGFHGISHEYCCQRAAQLMKKDLSDLRIVSCHLGNGCSLAAVKKGRCVDTSMGFTPLDGLMMGTRAGSLDPGIILHLLRTGQHTIDSLEHILNYESGLLGISGISNDIREIDTAIGKRNPQAILALEMYVDRLASGIAACLPKLGGLDALIFTGGVGENYVKLRTAMAEKLRCIGVEADSSIQTTPSSCDIDIAKADASVRFFVIHTQEAWQIARHCGKFLSNQT